MNFKITLNLSYQICGHLISEWIIWLNRIKFLLQKLYTLWITQFYKCLYPDSVVIVHNGSDSLCKALSIKKNFNILRI